jgi:hypothetical protein
MNGSLDFLNMIKAQAKSSGNGAGAGAVKKEPAAEVDAAVCSENKAISADGGALFAVIDTETNWHDEVMSLGVAFADSKSFRCIDKRYYIFEPEANVGGMYSAVLNKCDVRPLKCDRKRGIADLREYLLTNSVSKILAYNAKFDLGHLSELSDFEWFDIMRLAAYRQYNSAITDDLPLFKTGRLKTNYGVEPIMRMLSGNTGYFETHNAINDAVDELKIAELLGHPLTLYDCARI